MQGFIQNIEALTISNNNFRKVLYTGQHAQLVVMSLLPKEDIGLEVHATTDQFLRIEAGEGTVILNGAEQSLTDGSAIFVPAGTEHNIINASETEPLKLYTIYSPSHHRDGTIHRTKQDAKADTEDQ